MLENIKFLIVENASSPRYRVSGTWNGSFREILLTLQESEILRLLSNKEKLELAEKKLVSEEEMNELKASTLGSYIGKAYPAERKADDLMWKKNHNVTDKITPAEYKDAVKKRRERRKGVENAEFNLKNGNYQESVSESSSSLSDSLKSAFASEFAFYLKSHFFHWNIEGPDFAEFHELFNMIYTEVYETLDDFAENIRKIGEYAPGSFSKFEELSEIEEAENVPASLEMVKILLSDSVKMESIFAEVYEIAEKEKQFGLANYLADRQDAHAKHSWMLKSTLKRKGMNEEVLEEKNFSILYNRKKQMPDLEGWPFSNKRERENQTNNNKRRTQPRGKFKANTTGHELWKSIYGNSSRANKKYWGFDPYAGETNEAKEEVSVGFTSFKDFNK